MRDAFADLVLGSFCLGCGRPGRRVCVSCRAALPGPGAAFPAAPQPRPPGLVPVLAAAEYGGLVRALVLRHKEDRAFGLVAPLADLLEVAVGGVLSAVLSTALSAALEAASDGALDGASDGASIGAPPGIRPVLVPVPSRPAVVRSRGHDPLARIARRTGRSIGVPMAPLLRQARRTDDQGELDAEARAANLAGALTVRPRAVARLCRTGPVMAVLCDDVVTTGSTLREAQRALEAAGVPVLAGAVVAATRLRRRFATALPPVRLTSVYGVRPGPWLRQAGHEPGMSS